MSGDVTFPATVGQLSVWRDIEKMPPERRWEANLVFVWDLPAGDWAEEQVWDALGALGMRHGSLRTTFDVDAAGFPRQRIAVDTAAEVRDRVRQGTAAVAEREAMESAQLQRAIDATCELPWRAWILTGDGAPVQVLLVINHMAADGVAVLVMREDFEQLLRGAELPPARGPLEMAIDQQGEEGSGRLRTAERYWRRTLAAAPRLATGARQGSPLGATLHTGIPMPHAHEGAAKHDVTLASLVLTAYYRALREVTAENAQLLFPMSSNRFDEQHAGVVTSLNQWTPLVLDLDPAEPFDAIVPKVHWKTFQALKNGVCSPDAILAIRAEQERQDPPVDPGYYYNPILAPPGFPSEDTMVRPSLEWYEPARSTGPGFYVIARGLTSLDLVVRVNRSGWDRDTLDRALTSIQSTLAEALSAHPL
ncbi:condensation domain-containing protein [Dactylosporangium fulvum]|uniref:Condensation domain-containing protein n=1 Tax=Dactylosporangium fulvum TaxID=53359 RepID=A0ABY5W6V7_9ACTN|nr:condensation domain-containing protein [Dactylosporangium fulvum]UWP84994.1 condensation domain-containing protein [Dactylosporangium fulvum]